MAQYHDRWDDRTDTPTISGRVLLAGTGFLVSSAIWALLAAAQYHYFGNHLLGLLNVALMLAHFVVGPLVLMRKRISWPLGLGLMVIALVACVLNGYYLAVIADGVSGGLLFFCRADLGAPTLRQHIPGR